MRFLPTMQLKVQLFAGTYVADAAADLCELASRVGTLCEAEFNGVHLWARPGDDPARLVAAWDEQMKRPSGVYKIAQARNAPGVTPAGVPASSNDQEKGLGACPISRATCGDKTHEREPEGSNRRARGQEQGGGETGRCDAVRASGPESGARGVDAGQHEEVAAEPGPSAPALSDEVRQKLIEAAITKATGAHRVLNAYDYEDVFACCEAVLTSGVKGPDHG